MPDIENRRLLILDDEQEIRSGYKNALSPHFEHPIVSSRISDKPTGPIPTEPGFDIVEANSGEQGLEILTRDLKNGVHFAGAFVDVRMKGKMDGLEFIQKAWKLDPNLNVVVVTAFQDRSVDEINRMFTRPFQDQWDYLSKPFTTGEIIQKARNIVSSWNRRAREKTYLLQIKEHQTALIEQERLAAVGRLARSVGHEFGNVLQPLLAQLDIAKAQLNNNDLTGLNASIDEMTEAATLGSSICQDLLTFSRETRETQPTGAIQSVSVLKTVQRSLRLLRHEIQKRDAQIEVQIPEDLTLHFRESQLVQVLINLLKNSLDALSDGGQIKLTGSSTATHIVLEVQDKGAGISEENLHLLFQPLFSTKGEYGNGIGLAACKQIIEEHSGEISIRSQERVGTTVTLRFQK